MRKIYVQCPTECYLRHVKWKIKLWVLSLLLCGATESEVNVQANNREGGREREKKRSEWINERKESNERGMKSECV